MPQHPYQTIGESEGNAIAKCLPNARHPSGAKTMVPGTIVSAHFEMTNDYVQITGLLDHSYAELVPGDDGGQYDDALGGSEPLSQCEGFGSYVEILSWDRFCVRCCHTEETGPESPCNMHRDTEGCFEVIGGSYGPGFTYADKRQGRIGAVEDDNGQTQSP